MRFPRMMLAALGAALVTVAAAQTPTPTPQPDAPTAATMPVPPPPVPTGAKAWLLMDFDTGQILAGENIDVRMEPASITKVMTSYVAAAESKNGKIKPDDLVTISERAWREGGAGTDGSYSGFELNSRVKLSDIEKGLSVQSGNDAAIAIAEHVAGSAEAFASLMNIYAKRIGMTNSNFVNAHGLPAENHYTTARDLALLGRAMIRDFPETYAYNSIKEYTVGTITQHNRNGLLWREGSGVDGIKTGHTSTAGYCLLASAKRGDQRFVSVVMGIDAKSQGEGFRLRENGNLNLLEWGFRFFESHQLYAANAKIATHKVWKGTVNQIDLGITAPLVISVERGRYSQLKPTMDVAKTLIAPITKGQVIGKLRVTLDGKLIAERPLVALQASEQANIFKRLWHSFLLWWNS
ncbi:MAG: D-alanyl-D-alanine carboxypeptidase [Gammaproteobacteria bacterium]|nr:D-alanyl-D-alanine carboxypeptidase [Gammaproteobacteria bacterium]